MRERVILADCCEDWIIEWGGFYAAGREFACPECATGWAKGGPGRFARDDGREFARRERSGPEAAFPFLASVDGQEPDVERCCAKILIGHGPGMADGRFACPVCGTQWERRTDRLHGFRVPVFVKPGLDEPLTIQPGRRRPFLVAMSEYSPPRD
ncbi:MAG: hypothetical protein H0V71_09100 [Chloroflexi bacterium]|nr:hypothetical protein [Chloroflexota bacterium]MDQ3401595.1 hypothetical protein [Chloroflexota bacterium]